MRGALEVIPAGKIADVVGDVERDRLDRVGDEAVVSSDVV
jgi:hypothetical protein